MSDSRVKYPAVAIVLTGQNGNAYVIMTRVGAALRQQVGRAAADAFYAEARDTRSYDELLQLVMRTVATY